MEAAPGVKKGVAGKRKSITLSLGTAQLEMVPIIESPRTPWARCVPVFDAVAYAGIILRVPHDRFNFEGRSHSLGYCDASKRTAMNGSKRRSWSRPWYRRRPPCARSWQILDPRPRLRFGLDWPNFN